MQKVNEVELEAVGINLRTRRTQHSGGWWVGRRPAVKTVISTPRQKIKVVVGLRNDPSWGRLIEDDSTLQEMDAPEVIPAGSSRPSYPSDEILRGYTRETVVFRGGWK